MANDPFLITISQNVPYSMRSRMVYKLTISSNNFARYNHQGANVGSANVCGNYNIHKDENGFVKFAILCLIFRLL